MTETVTGLAEAEGKLRAAEDRLKEAQAELSNPDIELEDMKILEGATFGEKNESYTRLMSEVNEARDEYMLKNGLAQESQLIEQRRRNAQMGKMVLADAAAGTPPEVREEKMQAALSASQFAGQNGKAPVRGINEAMLAMPPMREFMGNWLEASGGDFANFRGEVKMGEAYSNYVFPGGSWAYGRPMNDLTAQLATVQTGDGQAANTTEGTRPTIMVTTLPDPYTSVVGLVNTMNVDTVDSQWWIENTRDDLTNDEFATAENTPGHEIQIEGQLYNISTRRHAVWTTVTKQVLNNGIQMQSIIMDRLPTLGRRALDQELVVGNGTSPNLRGIVNWAGFATTVPDPFVQDHSVASTDAPQGAVNMTEEEIRALRRTIFSAATQIMRDTGGAAAPNAMVFDWAVYDALLTALDDNGRPLTAENFSVGIPPNILGMPVLPTSWLTMGADGTNFGILADWNKAILQVQSNLDGGGVIVSLENEDNRKRGAVTFIHERQVGFVLEMPQAFAIFRRS